MNSTLGTPNRTINKSDRFALRRAQTKKHTQVTDSVLDRSGISGYLDQTADALNLSDYMENIEDTIDPETTNSALKLKTTPLNSKKLIRKDSIKK